MEDEISAYVKTSRIGNKSFDLEYALVKTTGDTEEVCTSGLTACVVYDYRLNKSVVIPEYQKSKMQNFEANAQSQGSQA